MSLDDDSLSSPPPLDDEGGKDTDDSLFASAISPTPMNNFDNDDESPFGDNQNSTKIEIATPTPTTPISDRISTSTASTGTAILREY